jgi:microcompartment protein CcmK/EutM
MIIGKVNGTAVSTLKQDSLANTKLLLVTPADQTGKETGVPFLAVDLVGAGEGELVFVTQGSSARAAAGSFESAADAAVVGILDSLHYGGESTFIKR